MSKGEMAISALMLVTIAAAANARAESVSPSAPEALAAFDYEKDKARANFESARDRCAEEEGSQGRCETRARADFKARVAGAKTRYDAQARESAAR